MPKYHLDVIFFPQLGLMSQHTNVYDTFYLTQLDAMIAAISTWPDANHYIEKFGRLRGSLVERGSKAFEPIPNHFNTLNHGDMFVYLNQDIFLNTKFLY